MDLELHPPCAPSASSHVPSCSEYRPINLCSLPHPMIHPCAARPVSLVPGCLHSSPWSMVHGWLRSCEITPRCLSQGGKVPPPTVTISAANRAHITTEKLKSCTATRILQSQPQVALQREKPSSRRQQ
ncbi:hypothetical protein B0H65DRAFT_178929 [Neurospora tetraspora]|uniref:Uncharacterized protein n=1 Tax=Neurospora tetraspora TaxID=94610 RepID=A0AAE0MU43_9PEZI|nr:hypothetical protein B0H65DRAFT_178929 [Neurospora tetraspora]